MSRRAPTALTALVTGLAVVLLGATPASAHTVRRGETLSEVASRHGVSVAALARANGVADVDHVVAGATLRIPSAATPTTPAPPVARSYVVVPGDTLSEVAVRHGLTVRALAEANGIRDADHLVVGRRLAVPPTGTPRRYPAKLLAAPERLALLPTFQREAAASGVPADLLMAMSWVESGWQNDVVSSAGARGIGQLMPDTVEWLRDIVLRRPLDAAVPDENVRMSARYLRWLLDRFGGDARLALAGYYQGPAAVEAEGVRPGSERYVANVLAFREHFAG